MTYDARTEAALLAHKRAVSAHRKAQAILRQRAQRQAAAKAMARVAQAARERAS